MVHRHLQFFQNYGLFEGVVYLFEAPYYRIKYADGDEEDMTEEDMAEYAMPPARKLSPLYDVSLDRTAIGSLRRGLSENDTFSLWKIQGLDEKPPDWTIDGLPRSLQSNSRRMADFFLFMYERQCIWERRNRDVVEPWSGK
jgi:hypothetical protein